MGFGNGVELIYHKNSHLIHQLGNHERSTEVEKFWMGWRRTDTLTILESNEKVVERGELRHSELSLQLRRDPPSSLDEEANRPFTNPLVDPMSTRPNLTFLGFGEPTNWVALR